MAMTVPITAVQTQPSIRVLKTCATLHKHDTKCLQDQQMLCKHREHFKNQNKDKQMVIDKDKEPNTINYFLSGPN